MDYKTIRERVEENLTKNYGITLSEAKLEELFRASALTINELLKEKRESFDRKVKQEKGKRVHYLCMEFLVGRSFKNNLHNLELVEEFCKLFAECGYDLEEVFELEPDAGLGNGGLGRLAACFMESLASKNYPAMGHSLRYEYGIFKQKIENNLQTEYPDIWLPLGEVWLSPRNDQIYTVRFGGRVEEKFENDKKVYKHIDYQEVEALPYDMMISGAYGEAVSVLRLWRAQNIKAFDFKAFSEGNYTEAMAEYNKADMISKLLYPPDETREGKKLRVKQQYFLVSAAVQNIVQDHLRHYGDIRSFPNHVAIHINDTHPALCIPELMRIFMDEHNLEFKEAWELVTQTVAYTNHTVMAEALERWRVELIQELLPRIYQILTNIDEFFRKEAIKRGLDQEQIDSLVVIHNGEVRMANLSVIASHKVNGVSKLHSDIIKKDIFNGYYQMTPEKFTNVTNGIAYRRWLCQGNPRLVELLEKTIGPGFKKDASELVKFLEYRENEDVLRELSEIKYENKREFAEYVQKKYGIKLDPKSRFDVQVKRFHEYKRQLLNTLKIITLFIALEENPELEITLQTFIFGGKAAPSYRQVKEVIELINCLAREIEKHPKILSKLNVVFLEDYNVSLSERLMPASEVSEQISLAGKEASGTGNIKFMINGALTLGTLDGANVEIHEEVGSENIFIFGMKAEEVENLKNQGYQPESYLSNPLIRKVIERLNKGFNGKSFKHISDYLLKRDPYMVLADFASYLEKHEEMDKVYQDQKLWNQMALVNIAKAGIFAADRSASEYAKNIWGLKVIE
jgi:starch phosphorylase